MKKLFFLIITPILLISISYAQNPWINYKIDNKLSVKLPAQPKTLDENSIYALDKDSLIYIVSVVDFVKVAGIDSAALVPLAPTQDFANNIKNGMLSKMPGFTIGDVKVGKWRDYTSYKLEGSNETTNVNMYAFMVIIGSKIYAMMTLVPTSRTGKGNAFYTSLAMNR